MTEAISSKFHCAMKRSLPYAGALGILTCMALTPALAQTRFSVTDLGALPGMDTSVALGVNDRGYVVGTSSSSTSGAGEVGFVWRNGVMKSTGKLPKGIYSDARSVNNLGVVVGEGDTGDYRPQAWVTSPNGLINIFPNNGGNTRVVGINDSGAICGFYTKSLSGYVSSWKPAIWTQDPKDPRKFRTTVLPILVGPDPLFKGTTAIPAAFNQAGEAAGYATNEVIGQHGCFWKNDAAHSIVDLGVYPGDWSSIAWGMNDLGQVVGESHPPFGSRPVVWENDSAHTAVALPLLPGDNYGSANGINTLGQAIGTSAWGEPGTWNIGPSKVVVWRDGGVFAIQDLLDPATGGGWLVMTASAINNAGQIAATATHAGQTRAVLLTPVP